MRLASDHFLHELKQKFIILLSVIIGCSALAFGQKVYSTDHAYQADIKVYVVDHDYQADLIVYRTNRSYEAKSSENKGIWFFTDHSYQADKKIYFVDHSYQADLKIYFTDKDYRAGWKTKSKQYLLY